MSFVLFLHKSDNDGALAAAIKADGKVVLASVGYQETVDGKIQQPIAAPLPVLKAAAAATVMAGFGIPFKRTSDAEIKRDATNAITACLAMHDQIQPLNENLKSRGLPLIKISMVSTLPH